MANIEVTSEQFERSFSLYRLHSQGWKISIVTSTHQMYFKKNWQCSIDRRTGKMTFVRKKKLTLAQRRNLLRGEVEKRIE